MKIIDLEISNAFRRMKAKYKTNAEVARQLGLQRAHVGRVLNGKLSHFSDETWSKIEPLLHRYMALNGENAISGDEKYRHKIPLLTIAQAAEMLPRTLHDDISPEYGETAVFDEITRDGDFAVLIAGDAMEPWYPQGTKILVGRGEIPKTGDRVVAMLGGRSEPVFKVYVDLGAEFALLPLYSENGIKPLIINKMDRESCYWVWPVKASIRHERDVDAAMTRAGIRHRWQDWLADRQKKNVR